MSVETPLNEIEATAVALAEALFAALRADDPDAHIGTFEPFDRVVIDGEFDLIRVAKRVQDALRERSR